MHCLNYNSISSVSFFFFLHSAFSCLSFRCYMTVQFCCFMSVKKISCWIWAVSKKNSLNGIGLTYTYLHFVCRYKVSCTLLADVKVSCMLFVYVNYYFIVESRILYVVGRQDFPEASFCKSWDSKSDIIFVVWMFTRLFYNFCKYCIVFMCFFYFSKFLLKLLKKNPVVIYYFVMHYSIDYVG